MPKFHVISGTFIVGPKGKQQTIGLGGEVELTAEQRQSVDPTGELLVSPEAFVELKRAADAHAAFVKKQKEASGPAISMSPKLLEALAAIRAPEKKDVKP